MKKHILASVMALATIFTASAQLRTSYFMEGSTFRTDLNPALAPTRGYINIPVLSQLNLNVTNNFLSIDNFLYKSTDEFGNPQLKTFMHKDVKDRFLKNLPNRNVLALNSTFNLIGFGAHTKKFFWAAGVNFKMNADITLPKSFFTLLTTIGQGYYDMNSLHLGVNAYSELFLGAAIPIKDWATVGFRVKGLLGLANIDASVDNMYVNVGEDIVEARLDASLRGSSIIPLNAKAGDTMSFEDIGDLMPDMNGSDVLKKLSFKNGGFALDLGAEFRLFNDHLRLSAAITDLGLIYWNKATNISATGSGYYAFEGYDIRNEEVKFTQENPEFAFGESKSYAKRLTTSLNIGAEYAILRNRISFGVLSHTQFAPNATTSELTASVNLKPLNWFTLTASHTFLCHNKLGVMGLALNIHPSVINFFVGADFIGYKAANIGSLIGSESVIPFPVSMKSANIYAGLGFSLGRAKYSKAYKEDKARKDARKDARKAARQERKASKK